MKVLIVEDDHFAREASGAYLDQAGHDVKTAASADEAEYLARQVRPDVVICDWRLGGDRDGTDVARSLQAKYDASIIFVTAYPLTKLRGETRDIDVTRYLRKPLNLGALAAAVTMAGGGLPRNGQA